MFPSPSVTPPTFTTWPNAYFQGIALGTAPFYLRGNDGNFQGVFMPDVRSGDPAAPRVNGSYVGLDLLGERTIEIVLDIGPSFGSYGSLSGAQAALRTALTPTGSTENPLFFQLTQAGPMFATMVRPRKRGGQIDMAYALGNLAQKIPIQFVASDPTLYAAGTQSQTVGVPAPLGGFSFPLTFPLSFGGGSNQGTIMATNSGDGYCYPQVTFTGPCTYPKIANNSATNSPYVQFAVTMAAGDQLVVNFDPKYPSALYYAAGSNQGVAYQFALTQGSTWFAIGPGTNTLGFTTLDTVSVAGTCNVTWASAYSAAS